MAEQRTWTTNDLAGHVGWVGDADPDSREWLTDGRLLLRISELGLALLDSLRSYRRDDGIKPGECDAGAEKFLADAVDIEPVMSASSEDCCFGNVDLGTTNREASFGAAYVARLCQCFNAAELSIGWITACKNAEAERSPMLIARRGDVVLGLLMGCNWEASRG